MLFAIAVPSILEAMIAELQKVRVEAAAEEIINPRLGGYQKEVDRTMDPRALRAEELGVRGRNDRGGMVRRRELAAHAWREKRQRGPVAGRSSMNIIAFLGATTLGADIFTRDHKEAFTPVYASRGESEQVLEYTGTSQHVSSPVLLLLYSPLSLYDSACGGRTNTFLRQHSSIFDESSALDRTRNGDKSGSRARAEGLYHV